MWRIFFASEIPLTLISILIWILSPETFLKGINRYQNFVTMNERILLLYLSSVTFTFVFLPTFFFVSNWNDSRVMMLFPSYQVWMLSGDIVIMGLILPLTLLFDYPHQPTLIATFLIAGFYLVARLVYLYQVFHEIKRVKK